MGSIQLKKYFKSYCSYDNLVEIPGLVVKQAPKTLLYLIFGLFVKGLVKLRNLSSMVSSHYHSVTPGQIIFSTVIHKLVLMVSCRNFFHWFFSHLFRPNLFYFFHALLRKMKNSFLFIRFCISHQMVQPIIILIIPYMTYLLADSFKVSGLLASVFFL